MPLALPSVNELRDYREGISDADAIDRAADLFVLATGVSNTSTPLEARIVKAAIMEMAWAISARHEDKEAVFSPFNSERLGSYSYTKASQAIRAGDPTGVDAFDVAVSYFIQQLTLVQGSLVSSEWVFRPGYVEREEDRPPLHDPNWGVQGGLPLVVIPPGGGVGGGPTAPAITVGVDEEGVYIET